MAVESTLKGALYTVGAKGARWHQHGGDEREVTVVGNNIGEVIRELRGDVLTLNEYVRLDELESLLTKIQAEAEAALTNAPAPAFR